MKIFLLSLLFLFFIYPFVRLKVSNFYILDIFFLIILISGIYTTTTEGKTFLPSLIIALTAFGSTLLNYFLQSIPVYIVTVISYGLFFMLMAHSVISHIRSISKVTTNTILAAICTYILFGMIWTTFYLLIELYQPGSFLLGGESLTVIADDLISRPRFIDFNYYSFVTLTTLGYGDILPISPAARAFSSLEALTGQLYLAILIAHLVALRIMHSMKG